MACSASSGVAISTNPKPRDRPVSRSVTTLADSTRPPAAKASRRRWLEVEKDKPPTKSFTAMEGLLLTARDYRSIHWSPSSARRILPEVRSGWDAHRAAPVRRAVPRPLHGGPRSPPPRGGPERRRRGSFPPRGLAGVGRAAGLFRGGALRGRGPLFGGPPLGGAGPRLGARPVRPEP